MSDSETTRATRETSPYQCRTVSLRPLRYPITLPLLQCREPFFVQALSTQQPEHSLRWQGGTNGHRAMRTHYRELLTSHAQSNESRPVVPELLFARCAW